MLDRDKFDRVLASLADQHSEHACFVLFSSAYSGTIELREHGPIERLKQAGLTEDDVRSAFQEIESLVLSALRSDSLDEMFYLVRGEHRPSEETRAEYQSRFEAVRGSLVDDHLRKRFQLKKLSKAPAFSDVDWDVKLKVTDAANEAFDPFPYATVKLFYQSGFADSDGAFPFALGGAERQSIQVNFTTDELAYLITSLEHARRSLESAELLAEDLRARAN